MIGVIDQTLCLLGPLTIQPWDCLKEAQGPCPEKADRPPLSSTKCFWARKFRGVVDFDLLISFISWLLRLMKPKCTTCFGLYLPQEDVPEKMRTPKYACICRHVCFFETNGTEMASLQSCPFRDQTIHQSGSKSELINHQKSSMDTLALQASQTIQLHIVHFHGGADSLHAVELVTPRSSLVWRQPLERRLHHLLRRRQHRDPTLSNSWLPKASVGRPP